MSRQDKIKELVRGTILDLGDQLTKDNPNAGVLDFTEEDIDYLTNKISEKIFISLANKFKINPEEIIINNVLGHFKMLAHAGPKFWEKKENIDV